MSPPALHLVPVPKSVILAGGSFALPTVVYVMLQPHPATRDLFSAERFILEAEPLTPAHFHVAVGASVDPVREIRVVFDDAVAPDVPAALRDQGYHVTIAPTGIELRARTSAGVFYAFQTLLQIIRSAAFTSFGRKTKRGRRQVLELPCVTIEDFPDFARRGVYHDTARGKVPTLDTLLELVDDLAHLKYNEFQLYIENNFEFRKHPQMYDDTTPLTAEELLILDAACRARHMDFVPSLTSLGHFERILSRPAFSHLAEARPAELKALNINSFSEQPWSLCVTDPAARAFLKDMYDEFAPNFQSGQFNICCDEAYDLGTVRSKAAADKAGGPGHLYVEWIRYCADLARVHGKSIQMWGDIILNHADLIGRLPEDAVLLEWGYEHDHKFDEHCRIFAERLKANDAAGASPNGAQAARTFYVCPGTSSWLTLSARTKNAFGNIHSAATSGLKYGASGVLVTDWGDNGHQQLLAVSLTQFAYGAAASWNLAATPNPCGGDNSEFRVQNSELLAAISLHLFQDPTARFAALAYDLGLTYERFSWQRFNASVDWYLFREKWDFANYVNRAQPRDLPKVIAACAKLIPQFEAAELFHPHAEQLKEEFVFTCEELIHTCRRTRLRQAWLAADPAKRNPEEETLRNKRPKTLPKDFRKQMGVLGKDIAKLEKRFSSLWLARNKRSRLDDVTAEFQRFAREYREFSH